MSFKGFFFCFFFVIQLIPAEDVRVNDLRFGQKINYIDEEGSVTGERGCFGDGRICFKAWGSICRRNNVKKQDTVRCELLHTNKLVHSVRIHITRGG